MTDMTAQIASPDLDAGPGPGGISVASSARPLRCLLVEDSRFDRSLVRYSAERGGVDIRFVDAATLAEARQSLATEDFELIILDRRLPDGDGLDLAGQLAGARNAGVPMIMLSGGDTEDLATAAHSAGCVAFIAKSDLSPEGLAKVVRKAVVRHTAGEADTASDELRMLLGALSDLSRVARMKPLASRLMTVVSDLRMALADADAEAAMAVEEISELCLLLWLDLDGAERDRGNHPRIG